ncbi:uncharacterized protein EAE97_011309 [Botrytis byssoidea]|uniref:Uncharacterized protein n=1 Tax=Botrytis byssoidea TaxID=139641 RepID=A0A9P5LTP4_9HELO|nr:uncharacterized protein EAE97_011309 [Botrytis byssoidea]KAF7921520.1 hypothetical protein EAE97_011309 [Botrytis byssoidea]
MRAILLSRSTSASTYKFSTHLHIYNLNSESLPSSSCNNIIHQGRFKISTLKQYTMLSDDNSRHLLYVCAGLSMFTAYKHTSLGFSELFPRIDRGLGSSEPLTAFSAKSNFLQVGASWALIGILQLKWAKFGLNNVYDKAILGWYGVYSFASGLGYFLKGVYVPLVPIWLIPALTVLSQF